MSDTGTSNLTVATAFVDALARSGVAHACVCPGSRSTPLAVALARHPGIRVWIHIDERSAAFFALGMARGGRAPVALLCSSGTAAANFLPAVIEAHYSRVPLIVLTADRPPELREFGAAQTIDQLHLYGGYAKWFVDMPLPETEGEVVRHARSVAARAVASANAGPAGVVHLNFPFREPLLPAGSLDAFDAAGHGNSPVAAVQGRLVPDGDAIRTLAAELSGLPRGIIVCGPQDDPALADSVARLAGVLDYPILADPLSQVRCGSHDLSNVIDSYDQFLRDEAISTPLEPEVVIRIGAIPTSKPLLLFLKRLTAARHILVDGAEGWRDPNLQATDVIHADPALVCAALADAVEPGIRTGWGASWLAIARDTRAAIVDAVAAEPDPFEGRVFAELAELLPSGGVLFAGNSMPVRDLDAFWPASDRGVRFVSNRGANGIDGVVSSALGHAATGEGPLVLVIGDLSFHHDMNGLLAAKKHGIKATIVVLNNDGGGIFSFLPQATQVDDATFEALFGTPSGIDVEQAARLYGASFRRAGDWTAFREAVVEGLAGDVLQIVEVVTERQKNLRQHRAVSAAVLDRLRSRQAAPVG
ncbi:MAG: 2-succinyl-5-enolpyruvyl-6-hydroxy-3-cyclohexene-1-carboxylic-acid synthase [Thermomicrobiales bacterium]|nr:2-succinyl-5-enolpyruvyl-6-hydroxy-3-cyclohexene-1-carboxylic-acid synthase [Thermomicrobiales bacterium]